MAPSVLPDFLLFVLADHRSMFYGKDHTEMKPSRDQMTRRGIYCGVQNDLRPHAVTSCIFSLICSFDWVRLRSSFTSQVWS